MNERHSEFSDSEYQRRSHRVYTYTDSASSVRYLNARRYRRDRRQNHAFAKRTAYFLYFPLTVLWLEFDLKSASGFDMASGFLFTLLFSVPFGAALTLLCSFFGRRANHGISVGLTAFLILWYGVQMIYYDVFDTMAVVSSVANGGAGQAFNSTDMILTAIADRIVFVILLFVPLAVDIFAARFFDFSKIKWRGKLVLLAFAALVQLTAVLLTGVDGGSSDSKSSSNLYHGELQQVAACERFGLFTMQRLDISRLIFGYSSSLKSEGSPIAAATSTASGDEAKTEQTAQVTDVDFAALAEKTDDEDLKTLYEYFDAKTPSCTNEYTGIFKDFNIIFITAESFSQYAIDEDLTPTLYKLYSEGFRFENFYSPAWGVSTTDGEYANLTGLIPKSGVWSFSVSAENNVSFPFTLGEQSRTLGYETVNAYHNHTYNYYDRDAYLTNIGYDYFAIGKGLDLGEDVWPNSDLKMMQNTVDDYINSDSFSVYYMTVSGHGGYSYNTISERNFDLVEDLDYSDEVKGYLAANIELDKAMEYLLGRLEKAGKLDNTVICLTDDHYPYSLDDFDGLSELAGHTVDTTFEQYKNAWLLWSGSMESSVTVETYCSSLDILPTLSNMLGFEYDSRMLSGTDVFGGNDPFVVFADRSWITQNGSYNASTGEYTKFENAKGEDDIDELNNRCNNLFTVSRMELESNVYAEVYGDTHVKGE